MTWATLGSALLQTGDTGALLAGDAEKPVYRSYWRLEWLAANEMQAHVLLVPSIGL